ncbi:hypothetical protein, partial [Paraburkholderia sp. EG304]|uniref:hypothetical protein n=1 Tax=Paraburkholderia sp. EG304 TaxID=3237015 RepID=UPI00397CE135
WGGHYRMVGSRPAAGTTVLRWQWRKSLMRKWCPDFVARDSHFRQSVAQSAHSKARELLHFHKPLTRKVSDPTFHVTEVQLKRC